MQEKYQKVYDVPTELVDNMTNINVADGAGASGSAGNLLPPVTKLLHRGGKLISFKLDKWGFKDDVVKVSRVAMCGGPLVPVSWSHWYISPYITYHVHVLMTLLQERAVKPRLKAEFCDLPHVVGDPRCICHNQPCRWKRQCHGSATGYSYYQQPSWQLCPLQLPGVIASMHFAIRLTHSLADNFVAADVLT